MFFIKICHVYVYTTPLSLIMDFSNTVSDLILCNIGSFFRVDTDKGRLFNSVYLASCIKPSQFFRN